MKANNHLAGYQGASSGRREYVGDFGYVWVDGVLRDGEAPYA